MCTNVLSFLAFPTKKWPAWPQLSRFHPFFMIVGCGLLFSAVADCSLSFSEVFYTSLALCSVFLRTSHNQLASIFTLPILASIWTVGVSLA